MTDLAELIGAAQANDLAKRSPVVSWRRIDDDQVARLLEGAAPLIAAAERERILTIARDYRAVVPANGQTLHGGSFADLIETYHAGTP
jgi:hypothetical protein